VALICQRLTGGRITAIDRSPIAIDRARARNAEHVGAGRVVLQQTDLSGLEGGPGEFDKAFAVNVNVFWTASAEAECALLAKLLKPGGVLRLIHDGPLEGSPRDVAPGIAANLVAHGFATEVIRGPAGMTCVAGGLRLATGEGDQLRLLVGVVGHGNPRSVVAAVA
jgi:SAM-dependent methyltransferase